MPKWTVFHYQTGLLYDQGRFVQELSAGHYKYWPWSKKTIRIVDTRETSQTIEGQEILTSDKVGVRITLIAQYQVIDAATAVHSVESYASQLYQDLQLTLRDAVTSRTLDELMQNRESLAEGIGAEVAPRVAQYGIDLKRVGVKDIVLPGAVRTAFFAEMEADLKGKANLAAARHEVAATRARVNAAKMLSENPNLARLQELETLQSIASKSGNVIVLPGLENLMGSRSEANSKPE